MRAYAAFIKALAELDRLTGEIEKLADCFPEQPRDIHWGHVGDLNLINEKLRGIVTHFSERRAL